MCLLLSLAIRIALPMIGIPAEIVETARPNDGEGVLIGIILHLVDVIF
ncbi:MAG: hypothetical protein KDE34_21595 [Anaerolineales bacterium]|nr:hypothetical protein [Anaerolineales bacterium]